MTLRRAVPPALRALLLVLASALLAAPAQASLPTLADLSRAGDELHARPATLAADLPRELPTELPNECNGPFCVEPLETRVGAFDLRLSCHVGGEAGVTCAARLAYGLRYGGRAAERSVFTGHVFDTETGLYNAKARYFDPKLGRFLTQDSFLGTQDNPPSLHRYLYGYANPLRYVDPTGHDAMEFAQAIAHGRGWDYASEQARRVVEDAKGWAGKVGMGISIAAANTLKAINSPGDMPPDKAREYYLQPENETEHHAALIADVVITALPLAAKAPEGAVLRSTRTGEAESGLSLGQRTAVIEEARAAATEPAAAPAVPRPPLQQAVGPKPGLSDTGAAEWRYQRYVNRKQADGATPQEILSFDTWKDRHFDPAAKGGRPGRRGGVEQVAAKDVLESEGMLIVENVRLGKNYPDAVNPSPNAGGGTDYFEVGKMLKSGIPESRERIKLIQEIGALKPEDRLTFVSREDPSKRVVYRAGDRIK